MALSTPTVANFPPSHPPLDSRSPSRSPRRRAQFVIRQLDPLLGNLSPDSTWKALQATETIPDGAAPDVLASSIRDASPAERELGIRAAFAAQKFREWKIELSKWYWPDRQGRALGLGFVEPSPAADPDTPAAEYRGCLPVAVADHYEARIEDIRDDIESLGIDDIKDHVLQSHVPAKSPLQSPQSPSSSTNYGRMRDFTALVTATVIQALPELAQANALLDTWELRLKVLRALPGLVDAMNSTQLVLAAAVRQLRDSPTPPDMSPAALEDRKSALGTQVSALGRKVDHLLDMLEGHEDSLPQAWIDRMEKIELDYATWAVEAQRAASMPTPPTVPPSEVAPKDAAEIDPPGPLGQGEPSHRPRTSLDEHHTVAETRPRAASLSIDIPPLKQHVPPSHGHKREISKVSVAESNFSAFSDISNAEILDARTTSLLPSPKVSVVDNPFRASRDGASWLASPTATHALGHILHTDPASPAKGQPRPPGELNSDGVPVESTPTKALRQLSGCDSPTKPEGRSPSPPSGRPGAEDLTGAPGRPVSRSGRMSADGGGSPTASPHPPILPQKSSKRHTLGSFETVSPQMRTLDVADAPARPPVPSSSKSPIPRQTLDDRIQTILTALPTKIQLRKDAESPVPQISSSQAPSSPTPVLTLSPAKSEPASRKSGASEGDIRVYHLTRTGQGRDAPPVKLFVRTVGDGRVMVRVGGGWADLGEYLREYSLHHASRGAMDGHLQVASFPGDKRADSVLTGAEVAVTPQGRRPRGSPPASKPTSPFDAPPDLTIAKARPFLSRLPSQEDRDTANGRRSTPPVPPIPRSYTAGSRQLVATPENQSKSVTRANGANPERPGVVSASQGSTPNLSPALRSSTFEGPGVTTTTVFSPPATTSYTPLGAAGPKSNTRRATTYSNHAWVEDMVGKARAVSGGTSSVVHGNTMTTTTTTTVATTATPTTRRTSYFGSSPDGNASPKWSPITLSSSPSMDSSPALPSDRPTSVGPRARPKNRMSLGDMGGIKRVFLRKKSEGVQ